MDLSLWKLTPPANIAAGRPFVQMNGVLLKLPQWEAGDETPRGLVLSGERAWTVQSLGQAPVLAYAGDFSFEVEPAELLSVRNRSSGSEWQGELLLGDGGLFATTHGRLGPAYIFYGVSADGAGLSDREFYPGRSHVGFPNWRLVLKESATREVVLLKITGAPAV